MRKCVKAVLDMVPESSVGWEALASTQEAAGLSFPLNTQLKMSRIM